MTSGLFEYRLVLYRRMAYLRGIEPDPDDPVPVRQRLAQGLRGLLGAEVPEEAQDQVRGYSEPSSAVEQAPANARDHRIEGHAPICVCMRVEEDFGVAHALRGGLLEVSPGQVVEVPLVQEHPGG